MFKKFLIGLNLFGNKIINAKVDLPQQPEEIANKQYVDNSNVYSTTLSEDREDSDRFPDVQNVDGNTIGEVLDKILFPIINPSFINPFAQVRLFSAFPIVNNTISAGATTNFQLLVELTDNDRTSVNLGKFIVVYNNGNPTTEFNCISPNPGLETATVVLNGIENIQSITYQKLYQPSSAKLDNYGNSYLAPGFDINFNLTVNGILDAIESNYLIIPTICSTATLISVNDLVTVFDNIKNHTVLSTDTIQSIFADYAPNNTTSLIVPTTVNNSNVVIIGLPKTSNSFTTYQLKVGNQNTLIPLSNLNPEIYFQKTINTVIYDFYKIELNNYPESAIIILPIN